ncbi:MAG: spermidine synthase, partial [Gammaproteobacteria bacterium]
ALYFELAIIRFTAAEVLYLGFFSNFILITAFVGLGVGFLSVRRGIRLDDLVPFALLFIFALVLVSEFDVKMLANHFGLFFFGNVQGRAGLPGALLFVILFLAAAGFFAALGSRVGRAFTLFEPLQAYSYDIGGSLLGIALFTLQSMVASGPQTWVLTGLLLLCVGYLAADPEGEAVRTVVKLALAGACVIVLLQSADRGSPTVWSTYQKLTLEKDSDGRETVLYANGIVHQFLHSVETVKDTFYETPYQLARQAGTGLDRVLIIGAGTGTDVAVALANDAQAIDAVEIDGRILEWGRRLHPDAPYADVRVRTHATDGRKFLHDATEEYDLIVFALPDSLTRISAMSSIRLESYLFTEEAFASVKAHLKPGGIFALYNQYRWQWLVNKIAATAETVFGRPPLIIGDGPTTVIAVGAGLPASSYERTGFERLASDDWPFLYMQRPAIHWLHVGMIVMFLAASLAAVGVLAPPGTLRRPDLPFFFMGMAFLLLETKSLAFFSLLFGTTWLVNSLAFAGILLSVLAANLAVQKFRIDRRGSLFLGLFASLVLAYLLPARIFLGIDAPWLRYVLAIALAFAPIFFANLVFSREFRDTQESTRAFGWNLLGAVAGGGMEYLSLITGYRNLLWIVALCYLLAGVLLWNFRIRHRPA